MAKQCNINSHGKLIRLTGGLVFVLLAGVVALLIARGSINGVWPWVAVVMLFAFGGLSVYQGWSGWCAIRALGFNTWF